MGSTQEPPPQLQTCVCSQGSLSSPHIPKTISHKYTCVSNNICAKPLLDGMHTATPFPIISELKQVLLAFNIFSDNQKPASKVKPELTTRKQAGEKNPWSVLTSASA